MRAHALIVLLALVACGHRESSTSNEPDPAAESGSSTADAPHALPLGHPVAMPHDPAHGSAGASSPLRWTAPDEWRSVPPSSSMRRAEWALPHVGTDTEDASLVVYYFGSGQGGGVEDNLERWYGQFEQPDGRATRDAAHIENRTVAGMRTTIADVSGTFTAMAVPGAPAAGPKAGTRMLAAIVETDGGPWFFKLTGPQGTVEHWRSSFDTFVSSIHR